MVLVTGATGIVGRCVVAWLVARGIAVKAATRRPSEWSLEGAKAARFDWTDSGTWRDALAEVDALVIIRPQVLAGGEDAVLGLATMAARAGCRRMVFVSGARIGAGEDARIEDNLRRLQVSWTFLRSGVYFQSLLDRHLPDLREGLLEVPAAKAKIPWVDARDVGEAVGRTLLDGIWEHRTPLLTGEDHVGFVEVCELASRCVGRRIACRSCSCVAYFARLRRKRGLSWKECLRRTMGQRRFAAGFDCEHGGDLRQILGRPPRSMAGFLEESRDRFLTEDPTPRR